MLAPKGSGRSEAVPSSSVYQRSQPCNILSSLSEAGFSNHSKCVVKDAEVARGGSGILPAAGPLARLL